jgi:hypothetical protein
MVEFECKKCKKIFNKKSTYTYHIGRKTPCIKPENTPKTPNCSKKINNSIKKDKMDNNAKFECQHCLKTFSRQFNVDKHIKNNCKVIKNKKQLSNEEIKPEIMEKIQKIIDQNEFLMEENIKLKKNQKKITNIKNQNIIKNQQINVNIENLNIFDHGKEKLNLIDNKVILNAINKGIGVSHITNIIESIYLNPELPKYQNICITDINRQKCMIYEKNEWILSDIEKIYNLIRKVIEFSKEKYDEFVELYENNKNVTNKLDIFKKYLNFCDSEYLDDLKNDDITKENREKIKRCKQLTEKLENDVIKLFYNKKDLVLK